MSTPFGLNICSSSSSSSSSSVTMIIHIMIAMIIVITICMFLVIISNFAAALQEAREHGGDGKAVRAL